MEGRKKNNNHKRLVAANMLKEKPIQDNPTMFRQNICGNIYFSKILNQFRRESGKELNEQSQFTTKLIELKTNEHEQ